MKPLLGRIAAFGMAALVALLNAASSVSAQVTTTSDNGPGSLRYVAANAAPGATIVFQSSLSGQTIVLTSGKIILTNSVTIDSSALMKSIEINGDNNDRVFTVSNSATVVLNSLIITNGNATGTNNPSTSPSAVAGDGDGGGIYNDGILTMDNCILTGNRTQGGSTLNGYAGKSQGGGIYNNGSLTLNSCILAGNGSAGGIGINLGYCYGGGICNNGALMVNSCILTNNSINGDDTDYGYGGAIYDNGTMIITNCALVYSSVVATEDDAQGGAIFINAGTATIYSSTLSSNITLCSVGATGAGIYNSGTLTMDNCTLANNIDTGDGYNGGAINNSGTLGLNNCTLANNTIYRGAVADGNGSGIYNTGTLNLTNSIVCGNMPAPNIYGSYTGVNNLVDVNALLAVLGNYGGPTETMLPLAGSPAIDAGLDSVINLYTTDQRGYPRLSGLHVDIGAVEVQVAKLPFVLADPGGVVRWINGKVQINFTNVDGGSFTVFAATNVASPFSTWSNLGTAVETPPGSGNFEFTDSQSANDVRRFYRVGSP